MNWKIKGVAQKFLSAVPGGVWLNDRLQRTAGELRHFDDVVDSKVQDDWLVLAGHLRALNRPAQGLVFMEIGTGWFPTLPLCYYLAGARECLTFDLNRHLNGGETLRMVRRLGKHLPAIAEASLRPLDDVEASYAALAPALESGDAMDLLRCAGVVYRAPGDAAATALPDSSVDVAFSNSVLEHVPGKVIQAMFHEQRRILKPGGLAIHSVNCGDHYAYFDRTLNPVAYLTYSERDWSFWNNDLLYQNRLRPRDFLEMATAAGFELPLVQFRPKQALLDQLPSLKIDPAFAGYPPEQLCCTSIDFVARR
jgi:SAM-dependent methyltransferase